ncbi:MAG: metallophosphoesterase family protein, partial [Phycisphaerales bacterium]|nr:metallophosphoesterase family protein [Phycisphaerales bacterium]
VYESCDLIVLGNHDEAAISDGALRRFNPNAKESILYTRARLSEQHIAWIKSWPLRVAALDLDVAHGAFAKDPWEYLCDSLAALRSFEGFDGALGAVGHTHIPAVFTLGDDGLPEGRLLPCGVPIALPRDKRCIVNPGSVGQPRDRNPDAAWALLDTDAMTITVHRVAYDVEAAHRKIAVAGLPDRLGERLRLGA